MRWMKILGYLICAWLVLGCSGVTNVFLRNQLNHPVLLHVRTWPTGEKGKRFDSKLVHLAPHGTSDSPVGRGWPGLKVTVLSPGPLYRKSFEAEGDLDLEVHNYAELSESGLHYTQGTFWDNGRNQFLAFVLGVGLIISLLIAGLVVWVERTNRWKQDL